MTAFRSVPPRLVLLLIIGGAVHTKALMSAHRTRTTTRRPHSTLGTVARNGLEFTDQEIGTGRRVFRGDMIECYYKGSFEKGGGVSSSTIVFDERQEGSPATFMVGKGELLPGCDLRILGDKSLEIPPMNIGGIRKLKIPSSLGYGNNNVGPIPANQDLDFEIQVLSAQSPGNGLSLGYQLKGYATVLAFIVTTLSLVWFALHNL